MDRTSDEVDRQEAEKKWLKLYEIEQGRYHNAIGYINSHLRFFSSVLAAIIGAFG